MNSRDTLRHIIRAVIILLVQVLVLKRIGLSSHWWWQHGKYFYIPDHHFITALPIDAALCHSIGFVVGLVIDMFYDTVGVHAFALTGMAYARGILLDLAGTSWRIPIDR